MAKRERKLEEVPGPLRGWAAIAAFLGQPVATAQRWAKSGLPVRRQGRYVTAEPDDLNTWVARQSGAHAPVHITGNDDLRDDLRRGLADIRRRKKLHRVK
jgi:hypothetical protein